MIDCLGAQGENGTFMDMCTIVLKVLRHNKDVLVPLTRTLVEDCDITYGNKTGMERVKAKELLLNKFSNYFEGIDENTKRIVSERSTVEKLIKEAKSIELLSAMFYGWSPFM